MSHMENVRFIGGPKDNTHLSVPKTCDICTIPYFENNVVWNGVGPIPGYMFPTDDPRYVSPFKVAKYVRRVFSRTFIESKILRSFTHYEIMYRRDTSVFVLEELLTHPDLEDKIAKCENDLLPQVPIQSRRVTMRADSEGRFTIRDEEPWVPVGTTGEYT